MYRSKSITWEKIILKPSNEPLKAPNTCDFLARSKFVKTDVSWEIRACGVGFCSWQPAKLKTLWNLWPNLKSSWPRRTWHAARKTPRLVAKSVKIRRSSSTHLNSWQWGIGCTKTPNSTKQNHVVVPRQWVTCNFIWWQGWTNYIGTKLQFPNQMTITGDQTKLWDLALNHESSKLLKPLVSEWCPWGGERDSRQIHERVVFAFVNLNCCCCELKISQTQDALHPSYMNSFNLFNKVMTIQRSAKHHSMSCWLTMLKASHSTAKPFFSIDCCLAYAVTCRYAGQLKDYPRSIWRFAMKCLLLSWLHFQAAGLQAKPLATTWRP